MKVTQKLLDEITFEILGSAIEVHKQLGPGLLEKIYERCLVRELSLKGMMYQFQQSIPLSYKGLQLNAELRYDILVENQIITEIKSIDGILPIHESVLLTYMRLLEKPKGIIINFNCTNIFKSGQKTLVNKFYGLLPKS